MSRYLPECCWLLLVVSCGAQSPGGLQNPASVGDEASTPNGVGVPTPEPPRPPEPPPPPPSPGPSCHDKVKNGSEPDVDCGGGTCRLCENGKVCNARSDCQSHVCLNNRCADCQDLGGNQIRCPNAGPPPPISPP
jgi:hypothetical protein